MNISVIIPVYNASEFLEKAVDSALQFEEVKEIVLVEDKSTDNSLEICQKLVLKDSRIKLYQHPDKGNHGAEI
jgi:glycosyltransferase involved in cell wall biosynthesis